jgi:hypothetical protein
MYAKVFSQILDSSIANDWQVRVVFEDFIILGYPDGIVDMTLEAISARTRIPIDIVVRAVDSLQQPDPQSRTPDHEGRRLVLLDKNRTWGWFIVNYEKYKEMKNGFDKRSYMRNYMRDRRLRTSKTESLTTSNKNLTPNSYSYSYSDPEKGSPEGENHVTLCNALPSPGDCPDGAVKWEWVLGWLVSVKKNGADYTEAEAKQAWLSLNANGWMWGKNPVSDWRSALECKIQDNRNRSQKAGSGSNGKVSLRDIKLQMDAIQNRIDRHQANPESQSYRKNCTELEKSELRELKKNKLALNDQLAAGVTCG